MNKKWSLLLSAIFLPALLATSGCSSPRTNITPPKTSSSEAGSGTRGKTWSLNYVHTNAPNDEFTLLGHIPFARSIEKATAERVIIKLFGSESGVKNDAILGDVKSGKTDIGWIFTGLYPGKFSNIEISTLPYLYPSAGVGAKVSWQLLTRYPGLQADFKDVKVLSVWITEPYFIAGKSRFYKTLADFQNQNIRAAIGPPSEFVKALGANPVMVVRNEVNQKFSDGTVDAALLPAEAYLAFKTYEVAPYVTWVSTVATVNAMVMNLKVWNSFPKDVQDQIMSAAGETGSVLFGRQVFDKSRADLKALIMNSNGMILDYTPSSDQLQKWIEVSGKPVWNTWVQTQKGKGLTEAQKILDEALALSKKYGDEN